MKRLILFLWVSAMTALSAFPLDKEIDGAYYNIYENDDGEYEAILQGISEEVTDFIFRNSISCGNGIVAKVVDMSLGCFKNLKNLRTITFKKDWIAKYEYHFESEFSGCPSLQKVVGLEHVLRDYQILDFDGCHSLDTSFDWLPDDVFVYELKCSLGSDEKVNAPVLNIKGTVGSATFEGWSPVKVVVESSKSDDSDFSRLTDVGFGWDNLTDIEVYRLYKFNSSDISAPELKTIKVDAQVSNITGFIYCPKLENIDMDNVPYYQEECNIEEITEDDVEFSIGMEYVGIGCPLLKQFRLPYSDNMRALAICNSKIENSISFPSNLKELQLSNVVLGATPEFPESLTSLWVSGSYLGDSLTLSLPDVEELTLQDLVGIKCINAWNCPKVEYPGIDFSDWSENEENVGYKCIETIIYPKNSRYLPDCVSLPNLKELAFGDKVRSMPRIYGCLNLKDVIYGGAIEQWMEMDFPAYKKFFTVSTEEFTLPGIERLWYGDGCNKTEYLKSLLVTEVTRTSIPPAAFSGYEGLEAIWISCDTIGQGAFLNCKNLQGAVFEGSCIETLAFYKCKGLRQLTLGPKFKKAVYRAFENSGPYDLYYTGTADEWANVDFVNYWTDRGREHSWSGNLGKSISPTQNTLSFHIGDVPVTKLAIGKVDKVKTGTFSGVCTLTSVDIESFMPTMICDYAFSDCPNLEVVKLVAKSRSDESEVTIGEKAFINDVKLKELNFLNTVGEVGTSAFENTLWYESQPDGLVYVGSSAYRYKGEAQGNVELNLGTKHIAGECFIYQDKITYVTIPDGVVKIGPDAFFGCNGITDLSIPGSVLELKSLPVECTGISFENGSVPLVMDVHDSCYSLRSLYVGREISGSNKSFIDYMPELRIFTFGENIKKITSGMVSSDVMGYQSLTTLEVLAPEPPELEYETMKVWDEALGEEIEVEKCVSLMAFDPEKVTLLVPEGSVELYKNAPEWNKFYNIGTTGLDTEIYDKEVNVNSRFDLKGRPVGLDFKGVVIEVLSDGTVRKVMR